MTSTSPIAARPVRRGAVPGLLALLAASVGWPAIAAAAPRIAVVVTTHPGVTPEYADEISYDIAGAIATQIEGEAIAGQSVRDLLPPDAPATGCADDPACGRELGATLKVDEVLFLTMRRQGKHVTVDCKRVPRDAQREPRDGLLDLGGPKSKRGRALSELVTLIYPAGSVAPFVEAPPPADPEMAPAAAVVAAPPPREPSTPITKRSWFWPVVGGGAAAVALAVILGVTLGTTASPSAPSVTLP